MNREIDSLKSAGKPYEAGQLAFEAGRDRSYGCHFGMRSTRDAYIRAFEQGWDAAQKAARAIVEDERNHVVKIKLEGRIGGWQD